MPQFTPGIIFLLTLAAFPGDNTLVTTATLKERVKTLLERVTVASRALYHTAGSAEVVHPRRGHGGARGGLTAGLEDGLGRQRFDDRCSHRGTHSVGGTYEFPEPFLDSGNKRSGNMARRRGAAATIVDCIVYHYRALGARRSQQPHRDHVAPTQAPGVTSGRLDSSGRCVKHHAPFIRHVAATIAVNGNGGGVSAVLAGGNGGKQIAPRSALDGQRYGEVCRRHSSRRRHMHDPFGHVEHIAGAHRALGAIHGCQILYRVLVAAVGGGPPDFVQLG